MFYKIMEKWYSLRNKFTYTYSYEMHNLHTYLHDYEYEIDEKTYTDLMLDEFKQKYNKTTTSCGDEVFDHWLHSIKNKDDIILLQKDLKKIIQTSDTVLVSKVCNKLGKQKQGHIITDLWNGFTVKSFVIDKFHYIFLVNIILSSLLYIMNTKLLPFSIMLFMLINLIVYTLTNYKICRIAGSINYFFGLCNSLRKIKKKTAIDISLRFPKYQLFEKISVYSIMFKEGMGGPQSQDMVSIVIDYLRVFLGLEVIAFKKTAKFIIKHRGIVREIIYYIGYLDCLINSKTIIENHGCVLSEIKYEKTIQFKDMKHPLIINSVGQKKIIEKGLIITGLNMAGKTSFMKSLGLNQLLATSFGFAFAATFQTGVFNIMTSFRVNDNLLGNQSRYYAEAARLSAIMDTLYTSKVLCLIDEILSGTNSEDRIYGATVILRKYYRYNNSIIIAATHDNKIAENLLKEYDPIYFDGEIVDKKINFDYTIKNGIVSKRNGLLILKLLGIDLDN